jgi:hypothetical protein
LKKLRRYDDLTNHGVSANEAAIAGALIPLDRVAVEMEAKWGVGVLPTLVSPELAGKFESARRRLDQAIEAADPAEVAKRAEIMIKGWRALDREAAGSNLPASWLCIEGDDGKKWCFVDHESSIPSAKRNLPDHDVWSLREVARVLSENSLLARVAAKWPEAEVVAARVNRSKGDLNDDIPF